MNTKIIVRVEVDHYSVVMNNKQTTFLILLLSYFLQISAYGSPMNDCFQKINVAWSKAGKASNFLLGSGQITFDNGGKTKVFTTKGSIDINGLSCIMNRNEKLPQAVAFALSGVALELSDGLKREAPPRKFIYKNMEVERAVQEAARVCSQFGSIEMDEALSNIELPSEPKPFGELKKAAQ
jgi:hypothetical protein